MSDKFIRLIGTLGAAANWTIPIASIASLKNDPAKIDPIMTTTLALYSVAFIRWSLAITPANYLLTLCHITNSTAQFTQLGRWAFSSRKTPTKQ